MSDIDFHYGYKRNSIPCTCGKHWGCGDITPEQRAAMAARFRDTMPNLMHENMKEFLASFERFHGTVHYTMGVIGTNLGEFDKSAKGKPLQGPIFDFYFDMADKQASLG